jgi:hypothetical protein
MDKQTTDHASTPSPTGSGGPPSHAFTRRLLQALAATTPRDDDDPTGSGEDLETTRELFDSLNPCDAADAMLAAIAVAAARSAMDNFARAARPGVSNETVVRLRSNGLAAARTYATARCHFRKSRAVAAPSAKRVMPKAPQGTAPKQPAVEPVGEPVEVPPPGFVALRHGAEPIPAVFRPRDRFGTEIPSWRPGLMTSAQALAAFSYPPDPAAKAAAIAEEETMMAEQQASEARGTQ